MEAALESSDSYDEVPYESYAIAETHPDLLACLGSLLGLETAPPECCRVLELGSAAGGNLIPMAYHLPGSDFVGVERSARQAARGQATIAGLGLDNCRLIHGDILDLDPDPDRGGPGGPGRFDYILVHGVYSWVPEPVREHILRLCGTRLTPNGIAFVSWNVLPGWHQRGMLRDMLLHYSDASGGGSDLARGAGERIARARELLSLLVAGLEGDPRPEAEVLRREATYLLDARASYLFHEYLEETNAPELFADFMARARRHGLRYLADARLHTLFPSTLSAGAQSVLDRFDTQSQTEQWMDFLTLRPFRRSLLVRAEAITASGIDLERLYRFSLFGDLLPIGEARLDRVAPDTYGRPGGASFAVEHPLTKALLARLAGLYPNALPIGTLLKQARAEAAKAGAGPEAEHGDACLVELFSLVCSGGVGLTLRTAAWPREAGERPCASPLARAQAAAGEGHAATVRHRVLGLDGLAARLLTLLDGTRDRAGLTAELAQAVRADPRLADALSKQAGTEGVDGGTLDSAVAASLERLLGLFARHGLLTDAASDNP